MRLPATPLLLLTALASALATACGGPLGPIAGGALRGTLHQGALPSPTEIAAPDTIQLETNPADPHSVNTWIAAHEGRLYIPTSLILGDDEPTERGWVRNVMADPQVRIRSGGVVYAGALVRVEDPAEREAARDVLLRKYEEERDEHAEKAWIYRFEAR